MFSVRSSRRRVALAVSGLVCAGLLGGLVSPAWAAGDDDAGTGTGTGTGAGGLSLGGFGLSDGLEAMVGETDGSLRFGVSAGGVSVSWNSRATGVNRYGFGHGWGLGLAYVDTVGGVRVFPSSGGAFELNASAASGLSGYTRGDVVFRVAEPGATLPARGDGDPLAYAYVLHELGGVRTFFNAAGDPVAQVDPDDRRVEWAWADGESHRLVSVTDADGVVTTLSWSDAEVVVAPGSNVTAATPGSGAGGVWRIGLTDDRVSSVTDPVEQVNGVRYDPAGMVSAVHSATGAVTTMTWHRPLDGLARVDEVHTTDADGDELSTRSWSTEAGGSAGHGDAVSGWPAVAGGRTNQPYTAVLSDGSTRVRSTVDADQLLTARSVEVTTPAGAVVVHEQAFSFEPAEGSAKHPLDHPNRSKPTEATVTYRDSTGASRSATESYVYDRFGRLERRTAADGTVTEREFDDAVPEGGELPIGLATRETVTTPDGSVSSTHATLNDRRTAAEIVEQTLEPKDEAERVIARAEMAVTEEAGTEMTEERVFANGDTSSPPIVTTRRERVDVPAGTLTVEETVAAGTAVETSTSQTVSLLHGGALRATDAVGRLASADYDLAGRVVASTDAAGRQTQTAYRSNVRDGITAVNVTGPDGVSATEERDVLGRVLRRFDDLAPSGEPVTGHERVFETTTYPSPGVVEVADAWGARTRTERDVFGRPVRVTLPNGLVQVTRHDDVAQTVTSGATATGDLADALTTTTQHADDAGRVASTTGSRADGVPVLDQHTSFDGLGRAIATSDGVAETRVEYDELGNPAVSSIAPIGEPTAALVTERRFDRYGQSLEKTLTAPAAPGAPGSPDAPASRSGGSRVLDELGRTVRETDQRGSATTYEYSADGLVERIASDDGQVVSHTYDDRTRALLETRVESPGKDDVVTGYAYDEVTGQRTKVFDPADRARTEISYEYDLHGNPVSVRYPAERPDEPGPSITHEYDEHGRKLATTDVSGVRTRFEYDAAGAIVAAVQTKAETELGRVEYGRDDHGRVTAITRGNGVVTTLTYTSADQIASEVTTVHGRPQSERSYTYDAASGDLTARVDRDLRADRGEAAGEPAAVRTEYAYDLLRRLVASVVREGGEADAPASTQTAYEYAVSGEVLAETVTSAGQTTVRRFAYSPVGELETITTTAPDGAEHVVTQDYDAAGNLVRGADGSAYTWDAANRQIAQTTAEGVTIETAYWADASRGQQRTASGSTTFYWDGAGLLAERHEVGELDEPGEPDAPGASSESSEPGASGASSGTASYLIGASRHARTVHPDDGKPQTEYYGTDRHGNVTDLTDAQGQVTTRYTYTDYGVPTVSSGGAAPGTPAGIGDLTRNPFGYAMEYTHADGSQFMQVRTYAPSLMAFTSEDEAPLHARYAFANGNPIMLVDPSGRDAVRDWFAVGLAGYGALAAFAGVIAIATGGAALGAFGVAAAAFGIGDGVFTAVEASAVAAGTKFMSDDAALGVGIGLALIGTAFGIGGLLRGLKAARGAAGHAGRLEHADDIELQPYVAFESSSSSVDGSAVDALLGDVEDLPLLPQPMLATSTITSGPALGGLKRTLSDEIIERIALVQLDLREINLAIPGSKYSSPGWKYSPPGKLHRRLVSAESELITTMDRARRYAKRVKMFDLLRSDGSVRAVESSRGPWTVRRTIAELDTDRDEMLESLGSAIRRLRSARDDYNTWVTPGSAQPLPRAARERFATAISDLTAIRDQIAGMPRY